MAKRDYVKEITLWRERNKWGSASSGLTLRLISLEAAFEKRSELEPELLRYFPLALIAAVEAYVRSQVREMIDHGSPFVDRMSKLELNISKLGLESLRAIGSRMVTLGDLVSHLLQISRLEDINSHLSVLTDRDFLSEVQVVQDRFEVEVRNQKAKPIMDDPAEVLSAVKRTFELRHIFAHEFANTEAIDPTEIERCFAGTVTLLEATNWFCRNVLYPRAPLTQADMNIQAMADLGDAEKELATVEKALAETIEKERLPEFLSVQQKWRAFRDATADFEAERYKGGSIRGMLVAVSMTKLTRQRTSELKEDLDTAKHYHNLG